MITTLIHGVAPVVKSNGAGGSTRSYSAYQETEDTSCWWYTRWQNDRRVIKVSASVTNGRVVSSPY